MKVNYHTHTTRCHHASGTEREYVESAIKNGFKVLGFADHTPYPFPEDHSHHIRMRMHELEDYINTVLSLRDEYKNDIDIHLGLEVEYFPAYFEKLRREVSAYPIEYFLLAQHYAGNSAKGDFYNGWKTEDPAHLITYCNQVLEGMDTGCFTYLAHPDLIYFVGDRDLYKTQIRRICRKAKELNLPLEINLLGIAEDRHYPTDLFWQVAGEEGCDAVLGIDAHKAEHFQCKERVAKTHELVRKYNLNLLEDITLRNPF
jgi:histidinol-phosphatase (PHP family)